MGKDSPIAQTLRKANGWYHSLSGRDQLALQALVTALVIFCLYALVWRPSVEYRERSEAAAGQAYSDLQWMVNNERQARQLARNSGQSSGSLPAGQSLLSLVSSSARGQGLTLQRFEPRGEDKVNVWLDKVEFNQLMKWLDGLSKQNGVRVEQISVDRAQEPGRVQARLSLTL